jgi:RNA polymerase sigma-70 factor (ECF subfamily)
MLKGPIGPLDRGTDRAEDKLLVQRVQAGEAQAFEALVEKYRRRVCRLLTRFVRNQSEVEDIAQEAFIKAYRALKQFRGDAAFYTWLYRIAVNTAKNHLVAQGRRLPSLAGTDDNDSRLTDHSLQSCDPGTPESFLMAKQIAHAVDSAVQALPEELRVAIVLRELEGMSYEQIASLMQCPIGTVRSRIFRARESIAIRLRSLLGTPPGKRW